jgi:hypothetical protein
MDFSDVYKVFNKIQENPKIFHIKINNVSLWSIAKVFIQNNISLVVAEQLSDPTSKFGNKTNIFRYLLNCQFARIKWQYFVIFKRFRKQTVFLCLQNRGRFLSVSGKYKGHLGEDILIYNQNRFEVFSIERNDGLKRHRKIDAPIDIREDLIKCPCFIGLVLNFFKLRNKISLSKSQLLSYLTEELTNEPALFKLIEKEVNSKYFDFKIISFFNEKYAASKVLNKVKPKLIVLSSSEGHGGLIAAAKSRNIKVVEYQHGVMHVGHPQYNWYCKNLDSRKLLTPDILFLFGQYWKEQMLKTKYWKDESLINIGNAKVHEQRMNFPDKSSIKPQNKLTFVYTTAVTVRDKSIVFFRHCLKLAQEKNVPIEINIKLHPMSDNDYPYYALLEKEFPMSCKVYFHKDKSLVDHFKDNHVHLSTFSASIFESLNVGVPTAILLIGEINLFDDLKDKNFIKFLSSPEDFIAHSESILNNTSLWDKWIANTNISSNYFYDTYSGSNVINHLNKIINE